MSCFHDVNFDFPRRGDWGTASRVPRLVADASVIESLYQIRILQREKRINKSDVDSNDATNGETLLLIPSRLQLHQFFLITKIEAFRKMIRGCPSENRCGDRRMGRGGLSSTKFDPQMLCAYKALIISIFLGANCFYIRVVIYFNIFLRALWII